MDDCFARPFAIAAIAEPFRMHDELSRCNHSVERENHANSIDQGESAGSSPRQTRR
jgi:hypothetical protein